jgi:hypothetical protein
MSASTSATSTGPTSISFDVDSLVLCPTLAKEWNRHVTLILRGKNEIVGSNQHGWVVRTLQKDPLRHKHLIVKLYRRMPHVEFQRDRGYREFLVGSQVNKWNVSDFMMRTIGIADLTCAPNASSDNVNDLTCRHVSSSATNAPLSSNAAAAAAIRSHAVSSSPEPGTGYSCLLLEYVPGESLLHALPRLSFHHTMRLLYELFEQLVLLPFTHYDLTLANLMLTEDDSRLVVFDFGRSHADGVAYGPAGMMVYADTTFLAAGIQPGILDLYCDWIMCLHSLIIDLNDPELEEQYVALLKEIDQGINFSSCYLIQHNEHDPMQFVYPMPLSHAQTLGKYTFLASNQSESHIVWNDKPTIYKSTLVQTHEHLQIMHAAFQRLGRAQRTQWVQQWMHTVWNQMASHKKWMMEEKQGCIHGVKRDRATFVQWIVSVMKRHAHHVTGVME